MAKSLLSISLCACMTFGAQRMESLGGAPGAMLHSGIGSRAQALGHASVAMKEAGFGPHGNPGNLALHNHRAFQAGGSVLALGRREGHISYVQPVKPKAAFGVTWIHRGDAGIDVIGSDEDIIGQASNAFNAAYLGYGYRLRRNLAIGSALMLFHHKLYKYTTSGKGSLDIGLGYQANRRMSLGIAAKNLPLIFAVKDWNVQGEMQMDRITQYQFPVELRAGLSYVRRIRGRLCRLSLEEDFHTWTAEDDPLEGDSQTFRYWTQTHHAGVEVFPKDNFAIRVGYDAGRFPLGLSITDIMKKIAIHYCIALERNGMGINHSAEAVWEIRSPQKSRK